MTGRLQHWIRVLLLYFYAASKGSCHSPGCPSEGGAGGMAHEFLEYFGQSCLANDSNPHKRSNMHHCTPLPPTYRLIKCNRAWIPSTARQDSKLVVSATQGTEAGGSPELSSLRSAETLSLRLRKCLQKDVCALPTSGHFIERGVGPTSKHKPPNCRALHGPSASAGHGRWYEVTGLGTGWSK